MMEWLDDSLCAADGEWFRSLSHTGQRFVCNRCPVIAQCMEYALADPGLYVTSGAPDELDIQAGMNTAELWAEKQRIRKEVVA